jgi:hypothetical protein
MKFFKITLGLVALATIIACGGGGGSAGSGVTTGRASLAITWPSDSRVVPLAAQSIVITMRNSGNQVVETGLLVKPATVWTSAQLNPGTYSLVASATPNSNGTGVTQATGAGSVAVVEGQTVPSNIIFGSTVSNVTVLPNAPSLAIGGTIQMSASTRDASGSIVLVAPSTITWSSSNTSVATVNSSGVITAVSAGTSSVTARFNEVEGLLGQSPVTSSPISITVTSGNGNISVGVK